MTLGPSVATANGILDALGNSVPFSIPNALYMQLHDGEPGAAGTANPNTETTRKVVSFGAAGANADGQMGNDVAVTWDDVATTDPEDATHFSLWDASNAGNFVISGTVTANPVSDGDSITFLPGSLVLGFPVAA